MHYVDFAFEYCDWEELEEGETAPKDEYWSSVTVSSYRDSLMHDRPPGLESAAEDIGDQLHADWDYPDEITIAVRHKGANEFKVFELTFEPAIIVSAKEVEE